MAEGAYLAGCDRNGWRSTSSLSAKKQRRGGSLVRAGDPAGAFGGIRLRLGLPGRCLHPETRAPVFWRFRPANGDFRVLRQANSKADAGRVWPRRRIGSFPGKADRGNAGAEWDPWDARSCRHASCILRSEQTGVGAFWESDARRAASQVGRHAQGVFGECAVRCAASQVGRVF